MTELFEGAAPVRSQRSLAEVLRVAPDRVVDPVQFLQYEVREGREAGEVVVLPKAFIANCNGSFILQLNLFGEE